MNNYTYTYTYRNITSQWRRADTVLQNNIPLTLFESVRKDYERFYCVRGEFEAKQNCNILTPTTMAIAAFLSRSLGLLHRGPGSSASLGHVPHSIIFSPTDLNFFLPGLYNNLTSTLLPASVTISHSIQPLDSQGHILIFLDRMHLLFIFWQLGRVGGQYTTLYLGIIRYTDI